MSKYLTSEASHTFKLLYLSSGGRGRAHPRCFTRRSPKGSQEVRLIDIEADAGAGMGVFEQLHECESPAKLSLTLGQAAKMYYGTPIRPFLQHVANNREGIHESVVEGQSSFLRKN